MSEETPVQITLDGYCWDCRVRHQLRGSPEAFSAALWQWDAKHRGHQFELLSPRRRLRARWSDRLWQRLGVCPWWLEVRENADTKLEYGTATTITCTLAALATSATFLVGRESTSVLNATTNVKWLDVRVTARITTGTTPTVDKEIRVYAYSVLDDATTYPDTLTGTDAGATITNNYVLDSGFVLLGSTSNAATSNVAHFPKCLTLALAFGHVPYRWGLFIAHSTAVNLHATGTQHVLRYVPAYATVI